MEFLRAIGPIFNFLLLAGALFFLTRKRIRKLFQDRKERIADALGRAADAQDQARHTAEDIAEAQQTADAQAQCQLADAQRQAAANTAAADAETARQAEAVRRSAQQTEAQLRSDMEDRVSDAAIGRITAAAAETFSDSICPISGIASCSSQSFSTSFEIPGSSAPITSTVGLRKSAS